MTRWHADLDMQTLAPGATVTVSSHHQVVRMIIADTLSIQSPDGQRFSALVMGREPGEDGPGPPRWPHLFAGYRPRSELSIAPRGDWSLLTPDLGCALNRVERDAQARVANTRRLDRRTTLGVRGETVATVPSLAPNRSKDWR